MMDIGPGDYVWCIQNRVPTTLPPRGLVVGRMYLVEVTGVTPPDDEEPGVPYVRVAGVECAEHRWGLRLSWFRPAYRPNADLIEQLKRPVRQEVDA